MRVLEGHLEGPVCGWVGPVGGAQPELLANGEETKNRNLAIPNFSARGQTSGPAWLESSSATG